MQRDEFSFYYVTIIGLPLLVVVLLGRFVGWWLAIAVWEAGAVLCFIYMKPLRYHNPIWRKAIMVPVVLILGLPTVVGEVLKIFFPNIESL
jgi:hypothetical protein